MAAPGEEGPGRALELARGRSSVRCGLELALRTALDVAGKQAKQRVAATAKLIELDTGHLAMLEQPAAVADVVRQRLA